MAERAKLLGGTFDAGSSASGGRTVDVCIFDIRMPEYDGIEVTRRLAGPDVASVMSKLVLAATTACILIPGLMVVVSLTAPAKLNWRLNIGLSIFYAVTGTGSDSGGRGAGRQRQRCCSRKPDHRPGDLLARHIGVAPRTCVTGDRRAGG